MLPKTYTGGGHSLNEHRLERCALARRSGTQRGKSEYDREVEELYHLEFRFM